MPEDPMDNLRRLGRRADGREKDPEPSRQGRRERRARRGLHHRPRLIQRRWPRRLLVLVNVVCLLGLVATGGAYGYAQWRLGQIKRVTVSGLHAQGHSSQSQNDGSSIAPFTLLVIGSDSRDLGSGSSAQFGNDTEVQGQRSDSIILVRVVPKTRSLALLSIPRDTLVPIPGMGTTRINAAFNAGTAGLLVTVLDQDFDIEVNHVVEFNFDTFEQVADAVGGVEQWFPAPAKDDFSLLNVPAAGCVNLEGAQALAFVRSREYEYYLNGEWNYQLYPESDLARIQRQQSFTRDLLRKAKKVAPTNIFELNDIISGITKNLTVDNTLSNSEILSLAIDYRSANLSTIPSYTYPTTNSTEVSGALDPETTQGQSVIQQWLDVGQTSSPASGSASTTTLSPPTTDISPSSISVAVENGSGVGGQASTAGSDLSGLGYSVTVSGDAPNFGLSATQIEYAPDSLNDAKQIQSEIIGTSQLVEDSSLTPTPYNVEVVTGEDFGGVKGAAASSSSTTSTTVASPAYDGTTTVDPDSSSIYDGVYVPPGLTAGETPQTCGE